MRKNGDVAQVIRLVLVFAACSIGCNDPSAPQAERRVQVEKPPGKLVVLGIDGLDWRMLDAAVKRGDLPAFAGLMERASVGKVDVAATGLPAVSPKIWTSFTTGYLPPVHGIENFAFTTPQGQRRLMSSLQRKSAALWDIANLHGRSVGVVNWWCTYPVEAVDGFVISDRFIDVEARSRARYWKTEFEREREQAVYPPSLIAPLESVVGDNKAGRVLGPPAAEKLDRLVLDLAAKASEIIDVDIFLVYTRALDSLSHLQWKTHEPLPGESFKRDLVLDYLKRYDRLLARFLAGLDAADHLVILSDHGFERSKTNPSGQHKSRRAAVGVFIAAGPRIRPGVRMGTADVLDIMPTLLELARIPAAEDMAGEIFDEAFLETERSFLPRAPRYVRKPAEASSAETSTADEAIRERLRSLGYEVD